MSFFALFDKTASPIVRRTVGYEYFYGEKQNDFQWWFDPDAVYNIMIYENLTIMNYREYGNEHAETILLLHGGGLSWWNYREVAKILQGEYHVILPILDGHADSDHSFTSTEENASEIISFIDENYGGHVLLAGGLSLGGQILLDMLAQRNDICKYAIVESAAVIPSKLTHALITPAFGSSYGLIRNRSFARLQFDSLHMKKELFEDYYRDTCNISKADMIAFMKANTAYALKESVSGCTAQVNVVIGEKETREILKSAGLICRKIPHCCKHVIPGLYHGEFSLNNPEDYVKLIRQMTQ